MAELNDWTHALLREALGELAAEFDLVPLVGDDGRPRLQLTPRESTPRWAQALALNALRQPLREELNRLADRIQLPPAPPPEPAAPLDPQSVALEEVWRQTLAGLAMPSTRLLLAQSARLARLDQDGAVVVVEPTWAAMVASRAGVIAEALERVMGQALPVVVEPRGARSEAPGVVAQAPHAR